MLIPGPGLRVAIALSSPLAGIALLAFALRSDMLGPFTLALFALAIASTVLAYV